MVLAVALLFMALPALAVSDDSAGVRGQFVRPSRQYSTGPLWVWNDMLTEAQIRATLRDLAGQHVNQVWVHPRPGLMTPYLGKDWFRLWKVALDEAERLDMNVWIYDENSYPSGFAGGLVPEAMPESRGQGLHFTESDQPAQPADDLVAVYRLTEDRCENVTASGSRGPAVARRPVLDRFAAAGSLDGLVRRQVLCRSAPSGSHREIYRNHVRRLSARDRPAVWQARAGLVYR